jgi:glycosyltransferase involved in cell wall biosynthesis
MAAGKPIVAAKYGGVPESVQNLENGLLIEQWKESLVEAIEQLWSDKALMKRIGENNLEKAKQFDWGNLAEHYIGLCRSLAARASMRGHASCQTCKGRKGV